MAGPSGSTPLRHLPYPIPNDDVDVPRDIKALADALDPFTAVVPGMIQMWPTASPPPGWHLLAGPVSTCLAADNPGLVAIFGATGGQVNLPDMRDRFPAMPGTVNGGVLAQGGSNAYKLSGAQSGIQGHTHGHSIVVNAGGVHNHVLNTNGNYATKGGPPPTGFLGEMSRNSGTSVGNTNDAGSHSHTLGGAITAVAEKAATADVENRPKFLALNFIIKGG